MSWSCTGYRTDTECEPAAWVGCEPEFLRDVHVELRPVTRADVEVCEMPCSLLSLQSAVSRALRWCYGFIK